MMKDKEMSKSERGMKATFSPLMPPPASLSDEPRIRIVNCFRELVTTPFGNGVNALCWPRQLEGDFSEVAERMDVGQGITHLSVEQLRALALSPSGKVALATMLADYHLLSEHGLDPALDCINGYPPVDETVLMRTDVCSFHVDSATGEADTFLCTYFGTSSEGLRNEEAVRRVDLPETRTKLLKAYGGADDEGFCDWLNDHYYDLHYAPLPGATPFAFGTANLWRVATLYPGSPVPPCIHRAPDPIPGQTRLLLIS